MSFYKPQDYEKEVFNNIKGPSVEKEKIKKIVVLVGKPGLGDLILSIPFFKLLSENFPNSKILYVGEIPSHLKKIFSLLPNVSLFYFPDYTRIKTLKYWIKLWIKGIRESIDLTIDTQRYFIPSLLFRIVRARYHLGYGSKCFFSDWKFKEKGRKKVHDTYQTLLLLRALGINKIDISPSLKIPEKYIKEATTYISQHNIKDKTLISFFPGAGQKIKRWPSVYFKKLGNLLKKEGVEILLFGNSNEIELLKEIAESNFLIPGIQNPLFFKEPLYTAALLKFCKFSVTNDCGGAHLSAFAGIPVISIFGPTSPEKFAPLGERNIIVYKNFPCSPCKSEKLCKLNRECLLSITPDEVFDIIKKHYF